MISKLHLSAYLLSVGALSFGSAVFAAGNASFDNETRPTRAVLVRATKEALDMPFENRMQVLQEQGPQGYKNLVAIMTDTNASMEARWRAITSIGRLGGTESLPELEKAMGRDEWFLRNAALVALTNVDRQAANKWARKLVSDRALVVRAAAVDTLGELKDPSNLPLLWTKLYANENFRNKQSLFVRRRIVQALAELETKGHEGKFIKVLNDEDETLHPSAIYALERLTGKRLGEAGDSIGVRRDLWKQWSRVNF